MRTPPPPPPPPPPRVAPALRRDGVGPAGLAATALVGGVLGLTISLGLASAGLWPQPEPDVRLVRLYGALPEIETLPQLNERLGALDASLAGQIEQLGALSSAQSTIQTELNEGLARVTEVAEAARFDPSTLPPPADLSGLRNDLNALSARLDAIAAGASPADATAMGESLAALEQRLAAAEAALAASAARAEETEARLAELTPAAPPAETAQQSLDAQLRLPLLLSGLEAALAAGRPFASELQGLVSIRSDLPVSEALIGAAASGLPRPDTLSSRFESLLPAIIAAGTQAQTGDWVSDALAWGRALLALRPASEQAGDTPEAVLSRLEAAIARRD
ncbi:MAG: COG4223 family protein, partial [Devosia sp.]